MLPLVDLTYSETDSGLNDGVFRAEVRAWLEEHLAGDVEPLAWNRHLAEHGWTCVGWPREYGGRGLSLMQQVIFHEEYARADAPVRVNHLGEEAVPRQGLGVARAVLLEPGPHLGTERLVLGRLGEVHE